MSGLQWELVDLARRQIETMDVPETWREAISTRTAAEALQLGDVREAYIEVRAGIDATERFDLITRIGSERRAHFERAIQCRPGQVWDSLRDICTAWKSPDGRLSSLSELWLEFDDVLSDRFTPSVHLGLVSKRAHWFGNDQPCVPPWESIRLGARILRTDARLMEDFERRIGQLRQGQIVYVGSMTARQAPSMKAYLSTRVADVPLALRQLEVAPHHPISEAITALLVESQNQHLAFLDITINEGGHLDLAAVFPQQYVGTNSDKSRQALRNVLLERGTFQSSLSSALGDWPGSSVLPNQDGLGQLVHRFLDMKVTFGTTITTKAYLGIASYNRLLVGHD